MSLVKTFILYSVLFFALKAHAYPKLFPIENYNQSVNHWLDKNNKVPLFSTSVQSHYLQQFYTHYCGDLSPWSKSYVNSVLHRNEPKDLKSRELNFVKRFSNHHKSALYAYGENFRYFPDSWIENILSNMNLQEFSLIYSITNRAITTDNLFVRALPTNDVAFYHTGKSGDGYPYDYMQFYSIFAGTPIYVLNTSKDRAWAFILSADFYGWVRANGIAFVNDHFIQEWKSAAKNKLGAIVQNNVAINQGNFHLFLAYIGSYFPIKEENELGYILQIPILNRQHQAEIANISIEKKFVAQIPLDPTPHNFARLLSSTVGRPYGWGNSFFFNDCTSELKNLFIPFGIWLSRNTDDLIHTGRSIDLTNLSPQERLNYLLEHGVGLVTLIAVGAHDILYIGSFKDPKNPTKKIAMTYQNFFSVGTKREDQPQTIFGQALFLPLMTKYDEDPNLYSFLESDHFEISDLRFPSNV